MKDPHLSIKPGILLSTFALALTACTTFVPAQAADTQSAEQIITETQPGTVAAETDRLIVKFKSDNKEQQEAALDAVEETTDALDKVEIIKDSLAEDPSTVVVENNEFLSKSEQQEAIAALEADPRVESVEPDRLVHALATAGETNEPMFTLQWALGSKYLKASDVWRNTGMTGKGQTVAIVDTGYSEHPDLKAPVSQYDFVSSSYIGMDGDARDSSAKDTSSVSNVFNWHGTFVEGEIAAQVNNYGIVGLAHGVNVSHARVLGRSTDGYDSDIADGIVWAAGGSVSGVPNNPRPATVINASLAYRTDNGMCSSAMTRAINFALSKQVPVVVAAGNASDNANYYTPSHCLGTVVVGATDSNNQFASYSNYGAMLDILAPGGDANQKVYSTMNTGYDRVGSPTFGTKYGTSMATPYVTSVIALMKEANPTLTVEQIRQILVRTGNTVGGYKLINPSAAIAAVGEMYSLTAGSGIEAAYLSTGGSSAYGMPISKEFSIRDGGAAQNFAKGYTFYWHQNFGAHVVNFNSAIGAQFAARNFENGYGFPLAAERSLAGGSQQVFSTANGTQTALVWSASTGVHTMNAQGAIYKTWVKRAHTLGFPTTEEVKAADGSTTVTFTSGVKLRLTATGAVQQIGFPDIAGNQFATQINWIAQRGITTGFEDGTYRPQENIQRAAMAAYFYRMAGSPAYTAPAKSPFKDVATTDPFYKEIAWFAAQGITTGYTDGTFHPWESVSREAMAAFFYRYAGSPEYTAPATSPFTDVKPSGQFYKEVSWLSSTGITTGYGDKTYRPSTAIKRDAMAAFVYRYMNK